MPPIRFLGVRARSLPEPEPDEERRPHGGRGAAGPVRRAAYRSGARGIQGTGVHYGGSTTARLRRRHGARVGSERFGLSPAWLEKGFRRVAIPMLGAADSLNVAAAAAILLYEARARKDGW